MPGPSGPGIRVSHDVGADASAGSCLSLPPRAAAQEKPAFETVIQRAVEAEREGRLEEAESAFEEAARLRPDHPRVHYSLAWVRLQRGLATEALAAVNQALALHAGGAALLSPEG